MKNYYYLVKVGRVTLNVVIKYEAQYIMAGLTYIVSLFLQSLFLLFTLRILTHSVNISCRRVPRAEKTTGFSRALTDSFYKRRGAKDRSHNLVLELYLIPFRFFIV